MEFNSSKINCQKIYSNNLRQYEYLFKILILHRISPRFAYPLHKDGSAVCRILAGLISGIGLFIGMV